MRDALKGDIKAGFTIPFIEFVFITQVYFKVTNFDHTSRIPVMDTFQSMFGFGQFRQMHYARFRVVV